MIVLFSQELAQQEKKRIGRRYHGGAVAVDEKWPCQESREVCLESLE
jgi:hypothetical protein